MIFLLQTGQKHHFCTRDSLGCKEQENPQEPKIWLVWRQNDVIFQNGGFLIKISQKVTFWSSTSNFISRNFIAILIKHYMKVREYSFKPLWYWIWPVFAKKWLKMAKNIKNCISRERLVVQTWFIAHFNRNMHFSISVLHISYV